MFDFTAKKPETSLNPTPYLVIGNGGSRIYAKSFVEAYKIVEWFRVSTGQKCYVEIRPFSYTKTDNFPSDWIAPGEFRYCGCGFYLLDKNTAVCSYCKNRSRGDSFSGVCTGETQIVDPIQQEKEYCDKIHKQLEKERLDLSTKRKKEGVKPLFWMEK